MFVKLFLAILGIQTNAPQLEKRCEVPGTSLCHHLMAHSHPLLGKRVREERTSTLKPMRVSVGLMASEYALLIMHNQNANKQRHLLSNQHPFCFLSCLNHLSSLCQNNLKSS